MERVFFPEMPVDVGTRVNSDKFLLANRRRQ
jgi:hypothetical protein